MYTIESIIFNYWSNFRYLFYNNDPHFLGFPSTYVIALFYCFIDLAGGNTPGLTLAFRISILDLMSSLTTNISSNHVFSCPSGVITLVVKFLVMKRGGFYSCSRVLWMLIISFVAYYVVIDEGYALVDKLIDAGPIGLSVIHD